MRRVSARERRSQSPPLPLSPIRVCTDVSKLYLLAGGDESYRVVSSDCGRVTDLVQGKALRGYFSSTEQPEDIW